MAEGRHEAALEIGPGSGNAAADPEPELVFAWAPFPVEFDPTWWLDAALAAAEPEPELIFSWAPFPVEFGATWWLDPERTADAEQPSAAPPKRRPILGIIGSLGVHLSPLLVLLDWTSAPAETTGAIPVQLVLEEPAPPAEQTRPPGPLASAASGQTAAQPAEAAPPEPAPLEPATAPRPDTPAPAAPQPAAIPLPAAVKSPPTRLVAAVPPPKPAAPQVHPPPRSAPNPTPRPAVAAEPTPIAPAAARIEAGHAAALPGPSATRDQYLAYLVTLTQRHVDLLPPGLIAGRSGETTLVVQVLGDGTIAHIGVSHSSGYADIDERVEQMVAAVGRFPPLPQWFQGPAWDLNFRLRFPFPDGPAR